MTVLLKKIGGSISTTSGIFLTIIVGIIALFIFSNGNVILSKFGYETATNLKSEVTRLEGEVKEAKRINDQLNLTIKEQVVQHAAQVKAYEDLQKKKQAVQVQVRKVIEYKEIQAAPVKAELDKKTLETPTEITLPVVEYNQLSTINIESVHSAYDSFFPPINT